MSLCLVGSNSLDELEKLARENFSEVVDKDLSLVDFSDDSMFDNTSLGHLIQFIPIKESWLLSIKWPKLPSTAQLWDGNPLAYLSHVFGHEGVNSLLSELVNQDLAITLSVGPAARL